MNHEHFHPSISKNCICLDISKILGIFDLTETCWKDIWVGSAPLDGRLGLEILNEERELKVSALIDENGRWDRNKIQSVIPDDIWKEIESLYIPRLWGNTPNGKFSCKSAYSHLLHEEGRLDGEPSESWDWIWKIKCSERMRYFIWTCIHKSLATNLMRYERRISNSAICPRCNAQVESIVHALRDCSWAYEVWEHVIEPTQFLKFAHMDANSWIKCNITRERFDNIIQPNIPWGTMFTAFVWAIWKSRNRFIFQNTREPMNQVIFIAKGMAEDMMRANGRKENKRKAAPEQVKWSKPQVGWFKLNTDGSVLKSGKSAAAGGLLRDDAGNWVVGFSRKLGDVTITMAELLAIREGLSLAWEKRIPRLVMESDSEVAVKLINEADVETHPLGNIIKDCRSLIRMPWECRLAHKRRSSNVCADALARKGHNIVEVVMWEEAPDFVLPLLMEDML